MLLVNIIGAGNLGKTIGYLLQQTGLVKIMGICNQSLESSKKAIDFIGTGIAYPTIADLPYADITFITTPDTSIQKAALLLSDNKYIEENCIVLHCSGALTSDELSILKKNNLCLASIHPMRSFAKPELSITQYKGTYCAMEGDAKALEILKPIFESIESITYLIEKEKKSLYHAAGVFASNYVVTLSQQALSCLLQAGVEHDIAMKVVTNIMKGTTLNLETTLSPQQSLTGPIQRGDVSTIEKHMNSFSNQNQKELYAKLGRATLDITQHTASMHDMILQKLEVDTTESEELAVNIAQM